MNLVYKPKPGFAAPGNSWPAVNHEEPNAALAQAKLDSGFYHEKGVRRTSKPKTATKRGSAKKGEA